MSPVERFHERRHAPRAALRVPAVVSERAAPADLPCDEEHLAPLFGESVNVSERGALVEVDEPICLGRPVVVILEVRGQKLRLDGRVARTTRVRGSGRIRIAVEFSEPDVRARALLRAEARKVSAQAVFN